MMQYFSLTQIISILSLIVAVFTILISIMLYIREKSNKSESDRYLEDKKIIQLEYLRKNLEDEIYKVSKRLELNEDRWKDINHLIISYQNRMQDIQPKKQDIQYGEYLKTLGISKDE